MKAVSFEPVQDWETSKDLDPPIIRPSGSTAARFERPNAANPRATADAATIGAFAQNCSRPVPLRTGTAVQPVLILNEAGG